MSRPKGSKNKKTISAASDIPAKLEALKSEYQDLEKDRAGNEAAIAAASSNLKEIKRSMRKLDTQIKKLEAKKLELDAAAAAELTRKAIDDKVSALMKDGKSGDDILHILDNL